MAIRFRRGVTRTTSASDPASGDGFGEWWAAIAIIVIASLGFLAFASGNPSTAASPGGRDADPTEEILSSLLTADRSITEISGSLGSLCREPVLLALELEPDCETGSITLPDTMFTVSGGTELKREAKEDVRAAMTTYLERLRRMPAIWESLEAIEIRGHSDPRAFREPYKTNLVGSQQRALGVLLFLIGRGGLAEDDREDLERLVSVSGVSFSRPPKNCPEPTRECFRQWRRVEIIPVLSESLRRQEWSRTVESVRVVARRAQEAAQGEGP